MKGNYFLKNYNINARIPFNDKAFLLLSKIPFINKFLKNKEYILDAILSNYIGDIYLEMTKTGGIGIDEYWKIELAYKMVKKYFKKITFEYVEQSIEENRILDIEFDEIFRNYKHY
ncbi:MAG: hypothetical protein K2L15_02470 [Eubacteriales bacterium]|nr:hypothetical protein [Eubacteriales bacterium]